MLCSVFHQTQRDTEESVCFEVVNDYLVRCDVDWKRYLWNMGKEHWHCEARKTCDTDKEAVYENQSKHYSFEENRW